MRTEFIIKKLRNRFRAPLLPGPSADYWMSSPFGSSGPAKVGLRYASVYSSTSVPND